jgi:signal transduction histidine kinase
MTEPSPEPAAKLGKLEQFAVSVAHDLNNLLTGILGNLELMQNRATRTGVTQFNDYLESARSASSRAAALTQRLLVFSGHAAQDYNQIDINTLLNKIAEARCREGLNITFHPAAPVSVFCDQSQAELALNELLDNAAEAIAVAGEISVEATRSGNTVTISVHDTGPGMPPDILARALDPFFSTRPNGVGKGLGLPIAERFARQAGGRLEITSSPGQGCTCALHLPFSKA